MQTRLDFEKRAATLFFQAAIRAGDRAAIYSVSTETKLEQPLTGSVGNLVDTISRLGADGTTSFFDGIALSANDLSTTEGRRVMLVLSDGYDTISHTPMDKALEAAQRADVVIYAISPAGAGDAKASSARIGSENLRRICAETGGLVFFPPYEFKESHERQTLDAIYLRLVAELRAQMVITYYSSSSAKKGKFHDLKVAVKRPGLTVSARKGYFEH